MARARPVPNLTADRRFRDVAADTVEVRTNELFGFAAGVLDRTDIERVHDMRVASRRLRAALEICAPCFPRKDHKRVLREVKALADDLGARRDPDVAIEELQAAGALLAGEDRPGVASIVGALGARQLAGNEKLARRLELVEERDLRGRLLALAEAARR